MRSLSGDYRYLLQRPSAFAWSFVRYADPNADVIIGDSEDRGRALDVTVTEPPPEGAGEQADGTRPASDERLLALALRFILPSSAYATMLIRELTKEDSSTAHHKGLSAVAEN